MDTAGGSALQRGHGPGTEGCDGRSNKKQQGVRGLFRSPRQKEKREKLPSLTGKRADSPQGGDQ